MSRSFIRSTITGASLLLGAVTFSACSAGYSTENSSSVNLIIASINGGAALKSDVLTGEGVFNDLASIAIAVRFKNPGIETVPSVPNAVILERYEIKYRRSDGRGVEGQDVPFSISGNLTQAFDVKTSGTDSFSLEVVRVQAKLEPPLRNLQSVLGDQGGGGGLVVTMFADITLHGRTISQQAVTARGSLQIDFANWGDES
jgi:hypothetical protein